MLPLKAVQHERNEDPVELISERKSFVDTKVLEEYVSVISTLPFKMPVHLPSDFQCSYAPAFQIPVHEKSVLSSACSHIQNVVIRLNVHGFYDAFDEIVIEAQCEDD